MTLTNSVPCLEVDIRKRLEEFELQIRFETERTCLGILGPSGCGKSMTLKSIAGILRPDSGKIILNSRVLYHSEKRVDVRPQKRRVGYLFQNYALFPNMTVEENIRMGFRHGNSPGYGSQKPSGGEATVIRELLERFQLEGLEKRYPRQLSGGQQQRTALARIFASEPEIMLLDEPFSALDAFLREGLRLQMKQILHEYQGISVMVTHDRDEAYQLCDRLLLMEEGHVLTYGSTRDVFADPGSVQAARLTGCKNISRIERLGTHRVRALDWNNLELTTAGEVTAEVTAIGIRAHDFHPCQIGEMNSTDNRIPARNPRISEMPFEWYVMFENGIWWKTEKDIHTHDSDGIVPEWLWVDPKAILLLK